MELTIHHTLGRLVRTTESLRARHREAGRLRRFAAEAIDYLARGAWHVWRNRRYLTAAKLANMAIINVQCMLRTERVIGLPYRMKIEPTNICNTKCQLCPTGLGLKGRPKGSMTFEQYASLIDQLKRYLYTVDLSMWGDPLIVPDIYRMVRYAHDRGIWTYLSSNLHAFKPQRGQAEALIESGLDMLTCSLHGASQETFAIYQPGKDFAATVEKVKAIVEAKRRLGSETPVIQLNFVVTRFNEHELESFQRLADELGCKAVFSSPSLNVRFLDRDRDLVPLGLAADVKRKKLDEHLDKWLPRDERFVIEPYRRMRQGEYRDAQYNGRKAMGCQWPWKDSVINWDGTVATCCGSFEQSEDMGNVLERPFHEIWNGRSYRMARRSFRRPVPEADGYANPCRTCPGFMV